MPQIFVIHPNNPQSRLIQQTAHVLQQGGVIALPTDAAYVLACHMGDKDALEHMRAIRQLDEEHLFTLMCRDLSDLSTYAQVSNTAYRVLKKLTPGAFTFILPATRDVPRRLLHPKRKTIGLRIPDNKICQALLAELGEPLLTTTLQLPATEWPLTDPHEIEHQLDDRINLIIDGGSSHIDTTTVIDFTSGAPELVRQGMGDVGGMF